MKSFAAIFFFSLGLFLGADLTNNHLKVFESKWMGSLTYLNYRDDKTLDVNPEKILVTKIVRY